MMMIKGRKAMMPPVPEAWAIRDKLTGRKYKAIAATTSSEPNRLDDCRGQKEAPPLSTVGKDRTAKFTAGYALDTRGAR
jgi:hypothetical protein